MSLKDMSQTRARAWSGATIWALAGLGFFLTFFSGGGAASFATDSGRHLAGAVALGLGFSAYWVVLWVTRQREGSPPPTDERDLVVFARAAQSTLILILVLVFLFSIGLWTFYESEGAVPVGWMWFLAYGSVIVASFVFAVTTLMVDGRTVGRG